MIGLCECGCGVKTNLQPYNDASHGWIEGRPQRFISGHNVKRVTYEIDDAGCWIWQGAPGSVGYGKYWDGEKHIGAHRYFYERAKGKIPPGLHLDHLCRVTMCVNPDHLEPVTVAENKRRGIGMKLNTVLAREIKARLVTAKRGDQAKIARHFHVSPTLINNIKSGARWKDVQIEMEVA